MDTCRAARSTVDTVAQKNTQKSACRTLRKMVQMSFVYMPSVVEIDLRTASRERKWESFCRAHCDTGFSRRRIVWRNISTHYCWFSFSSIHHTRVMTLFGIFWCSSYRYTTISISLYKPISYSTHPVGPSPLTLRLRDPALWPRLT